jgi:hypothetical protein
MTAGSAYQALRTTPTGLRAGSLLASTSFSMGSPRCRMSHQNTLPACWHGERWLDRPGDLGLTRSNGAMPVYAALL